jgi:3-dehydroquinate synthase
VSSARSFTLDLSGELSGDVSGVKTLISCTDNPLARVREAAAERDTLFVFDSHTRRHSTELFPVSDEESLVLPPGEMYKNWDTVSGIARRLTEMGVARDSLIVAVGGGVVCDIAAFAASIYMRGMGLMLVPTTLLAMVDAALGGKTGVDFEGYKNLLGSFYPAEEVIVSVRLLESLPEREYRNGLAEVIKHALLADDELFGLVKKRREEILAGDGELLEELIYRSQRVKAFHVEQDPKERGIRGHLNLGHTFAHALESESGFREVSHGEAVAWGMGKALDAGVEMGLTDPEYRNEVKELLSAYGYRTSGMCRSSEAIAEATLHDKKKRGGEVRFILQRRRKETFFSPVPRNLLLRVLEDG